MRQTWLEVAVQFAQSLAPQLLRKVVPGMEQAAVAWVGLVAAEF